MAWARVQSKSAATSGSVATLAVTLTSTPTTGSKAIGAGTYDSGSTTFTLADGNSNTVTNLSNQNFNDNGTTTTALFAYDVPASPSAAFTLTSHGSTAQISVIAQEVSGLLAGNTSAMLDGAVAVSHGGTLTYAAPTYSSTASNEYLVEAFGDNGGPQALSVNTGNGYTADVNNVSNVTGECDIGLAYKNSTHGAESAGYSNMTGTACGWISLAVAFQLAAGGSFIAQPATVAGQGSTPNAMTGVVGSTVATQAVRQAIFY